MIEKTTSSQVTLEVYGPDTWPDQMMFWLPTEPVGSPTHWRGACSPGFVVFNSTEQDGSDVGISFRMIFFSGANIDGLTATFDIGSMRIVDPAVMYAGPISSWTSFGPGVGSMTIDWGDGSPTEVFELSPDGIDPAPQHVYVESGTYSLTVWATFTDTNYAPFPGGAGVTMDIEIVEP